MQIKGDSPSLTFPLVPGIFLILLTPPVTPVRVATSPPAVVQLPVQSFSIECTFYSEINNRTYRLFWNRVSHDNLTLVIRKFSTGTVISGHYYKGWAHLKDGCTLQLDNPTVEDSGKYTVTVVVPDDQKQEDKWTVDVKVIPTKSTTIAPQKTTTTTLITDKKRNHTEKRLSETNFPQDVTVPVWLIAVILLIVTLPLLTMIIIYIRDWCKKRGGGEPKSDIELSSFLPASL